MSLRTFPRRVPAKLLNFVGGLKGQLVYYAWTIQCFFVNLNKVYANYFVNLFSCGKLKLGDFMINIGIDGHMGSGKSVIAKELAKRLGLKYLDTGAIFRTMAVLFLQSGKSLTEQNLEDVLFYAQIKIVFKDDGQHMLANRKDVTNLLRTEEIGSLASKISTYKCARDMFLEIARDYAKKDNCIMEGRDICTVVLPDADVKFFLTADENIRAERRLKQLLSRGEKVTFEEVLKNLKERDYRDTHRALAPLKMAEDSILIDSSNMSEEEVVEFAIKKIEEVLRV